MNYCKNCRKEVDTVRDVDGNIRCAWCDELTDDSILKQKNIGVVVIGVVLSIIGLFIFLTTYYK